MSKTHDFKSHISWTGNIGHGNASYKGYECRWQVAAPGKPVIECSNDPVLGGDPTLHNPEDMLINAISACHILWYLHLAFQSEVVVLGYEDSPVGHGESAPSGVGRFIGATLWPVIRLAAGTDDQAAKAVRGDIHGVCFIARSVNFLVTCEVRYLHG